MLIEEKIVLHMVSTRPSPDIFSSITLFMENEVNAKKIVITKEMDNK